MANKLYRFEWVFSRDGDVSGLFIEDENKVESYIGKFVYFGEILGKHSDVRGTLEKDDLIVIDVSEVVINELLEKTGKTISGYNPIDYIEDSEE